MCVPRLLSTFNPRSSNLPPLTPTASGMEGNCKSEIPSTVTGEPDPIPAIHAHVHGEVMSPTLPTAHLHKPSDPTLPSSGIPKPSMGPADCSADEGLANAKHPTTSLIHFFFAIFSISLALFIFFFTVAWFTVLRESRLVKDQVLSDANGVILHVL
jgi:hypothetical protein